MLPLDVPTSFKSVTFWVNIVFQKFLDFLEAVAQRCSLKNGMMVKNPLVNLMITILNHQKWSLVHFLDNFTKTMFFLTDMIKNVSDKYTVMPTQPGIFM